MSGSNGSRLLFLVALLAAGPVAADGPAEADGPARLNLRTLFDPEAAVDFDGADAPPMRWLPDGRLVIWSGRDAEGPDGEAGEDRDRLADAGTNAAGNAERPADEPANGGAWRIHDLDSGASQRWPRFERFHRAILDLEGVDPRQARAAARRLGDWTRDLSAALLPVAGGLAHYRDADAEARWLTREADDWPLATLSPDGRRVALVRDGDLMVHDVDGGAMRRITDDGSATQLNGRLDWVYQEEIYGRGNYRGFWWSPDSRRIALLRIDQSRVPEYVLTDDRRVEQRVERVRYPKAGDPIPTAELWVADLERERLFPIRLPETDEDQPRLIVRVHWHPDGQTLGYQLQNRRQTYLELLEADLDSGASRRVLRESGPAWVEVLGEPHWLPDGDMLWLSDLPAGRRHLERISRTGERRRPVTSGPWDVDRLVGVDPEGRHAWIAGSRRPGERHLYRVALEEDQEGDDSPRRLTAAGGWHAADLSPQGTHFLDRRSTVASPVEVWLVDAREGADVRALHQPDAQPLDALRLPAPERVAFSLGEGLEVPGRLFAPPQGEAGEAKRPLIVHTYGGPRAAAAVDRWQGRGYLWHQWLASRGFYVLVVDNRASAGRGIADTWEIYRRLGEVELRDLEAVLDQLSERPWFDAERVGLWGWSYGGYLTAYALSHSGRFRCGVAGAPVTDWRNYDAFYTERYMDLPENNPEGYEASSAVAAAENLHGRLLLLHGLLDDNVHPTNTLQLVDALQQAGKSHAAVLFPGERHGVADAERRAYLYRRKWQFWRENLTPSSP